MTPAIVKATIYFIDEPGKCMYINVVFSFLVRKSATISFFECYVPMSGDVQVHVFLHTGNTTATVDILM